MATGQPPWSDCLTPVAAMFKIANSNDLPPMPPTLSADGQDFIKKCLERDPKKRPHAITLLKHPFLQVPHTAAAAAPAQICWVHCVLSLSFTCFTHTHIVLQL
jgi:serine/threonine protein kinase